MQKGRRYRRVNPPNANLDMQPYNCFPTKMVVGGSFYYLGVAIAPTGGAEHSLPGIYVQTLVTYFSEGIFHVSGVPFQWSFKQSVSADGWHLDFEWQIEDAALNIVTYRWLNYLADEVGWNPFMILPSTPAVEVAPFPFGDCVTFVGNSVFYHDEP